MKLLKSFFYFFASIVVIFCLNLVCSLQPQAVLGYEWASTQILEANKVYWNSSVVDYDRTILMQVVVIDQKFYSRIDQNDNKFLIKVYKLKSGQDFQDVSATFSEEGVCDFLGVISGISCWKLSQGKYIFEIIAPRGNPKIDKDMRIIFGPPIT